MKITLLPFILASFISYNANAQFTETANVTTPGTLNKVAKTYLKTVTKLTLTGTIDARDFKTMRDSMPMLSILNLSSATIVAYTGTAGTQDTKNDTYAANVIPQYAFYNPQNSSGKISLTSITYPTNITSYGDFAFDGCSNLTGLLIIPSSVRSIGDFAFYDCGGLTGSLIIPSSITSVGKGSFASCSGFTGTLTIPSSVTSIGKGAFSYCGGFSGALTIPSSVKSIGDDAFYDCYGFTGSLIIPYSVTYIGNGAFKSCSGFNGSLTIPSSVTSIGDSAFLQCWSLTGSLTIPSSVTSIGSYAFEDCYGFTGSLTISSSVTSIGRHTFYFCPGFTGLLTIPFSVTSIESYAFCNCSGFKGSLVLPSSVDSIKENAFEGCSGFTGISIPSSVTSIGNYAFQNCYGLKSIVTFNPVPLTGEALGVYTFIDDDFIRNLYVPCGSVDAYKASPAWHLFNMNISAMDRNVSISASANSVKSGTSVTFTTDSVCLSGSATLQWQVNRKNKGTGQTTFSYIPVNGDTITCLTIFKDTTTTSNVIVMNVKDTSMGIHSITSNNVTLYPNPVTGSLSVSITNPLSQTSIAIYNLNGTEIFSSNVTSSITEVDMSRYSAGFYLVKIISPDCGMITRKVIKQ